MAFFDTIASYRFPGIRQGVVYCFGVRWSALCAGWEKPLLPFVTRKELHTARRFANQADSARHLVGRAVARRALHSALGSACAGDFHLTRFGKPFVKEGNLHFSITHSGQMIWVALCACVPVGIDIEKVRPLPDLADLLVMLHPEERLFLARLYGRDRLRGFFRCWARKEAVLKAYGQGLAIPMDTFQVHAGERTSGWADALPEGWHVGGYCESEATDKGDCDGAGDEYALGGCTSHDIPAGPDYHCSLFALAPGLRPEVFDIEDGMQ